MIGALPVAVAQAENALVGYLLGMAARRIADLHPGAGKTDARNAAVIAHAVRTLPYALWSIQLADDQHVTELSMVYRFDDDVLGQIVATANRICGLLTEIHPVFERVLGPHLDHAAVLDLRQKYPSSEPMKAADMVGVGNRLTKRSSRMGRRLAGG